MTLSLEVFLDTLARYLSASPSRTRTSPDVHNKFDTLSPFLTMTNKESFDLRQKAFDQSYSSLPGEDEPLDHLFLAKDHPQAHMYASWAKK